MGVALKMGGSSIMNFCAPFSPPLSHFLLRHSSSCVLPLSSPILFSCLQLLHRITLIFLWSLFQLQSDPLLPLFSFHSFYVTFYFPLFSLMLPFSFQCYCFLAGITFHHFYKLLQQGGGTFITFSQEFPLLHTCTQTDMRAGTYTHNGVVGTDCLWQSVLIGSEWLLPLVGEWNGYF